MSRRDEPVTVGVLTDALREVAEKIDDSVREVEGHVEQPALRDVVRYTGSVWRHTMTELVKALEKEDKT